MTTTGTTAFNLQINDILEEAFERASGGARELRSGYDFRTARRSLNLLTIEWASRGINLWTLESGSLPLVAGTSRYTLPADTIDLVEHSIRQNVGNVATQTDLTINRVSVSTYATIPNKLTQGRPVQIFIERLVDAPHVNLWPVPSDNSYTLYYWRLRRMQDAGTGVNTQDIPFRMLTAMVAGLAYYIAMKLPEGVQLLPMLKAEYDNQWDLASSEDREKAPVRFVPRITRM